MIFVGNPCGSEGNLVIIVGNLQAYKGNLSIAKGNPLNFKGKPKDSKRIKEFPKGILPFLLENHLIPEGFFDFMRKYIHCQREA